MRPGRNARFNSRPNQGVRTNGDSPHNEGHFAKSQDEGFRSRNGNNAKHRVERSEKRSASGKQGQGAKQQGSGKPGKRREGKGGYDYSRFADNVKHEAIK